MKILILHPDLGIGGAERLIIDIILALKSKNHDVDIYTNHYDKNHAFDETLNLKINVIGDWIPRKIFNRYFYALFAYLRFLYLSFYIIFCNIKADLIICDQIPVGIPLLKWFCYKILFYCHFPDLLLTKRDNTLKSLYRYPIDFLEEWSMSFADKIIVNSNYTASTVNETFKRFICHKKDIDILYPCISKNCLILEDMNESGLATLFPNKKRFIYLSINRYEDKKNIQLVIYAFAQLLEWLNTLEHSSNHKEFVSSLNRNQFGLVIAGGYDPNLPENAQVFTKLHDIAKQLGLQIETEVLFLKSISNTTKRQLLDTCTALCYTPSGEHFGIVPLEGSARGKPVIAVDDGGPRETVVPGITGYLCPRGNVPSFTLAMWNCLGLPDTLMLPAAVGSEEDSILSDTAFSSKKSSFDTVTSFLEQTHHPENLRSPPSTSVISADTISSKDDDSTHNIIDSNLIMENNKILNSSPMTTTRDNETADIFEENDENDWDKLSPTELIGDDCTDPLMKINSSGSAPLLECPIKPENCIAHVQNNFSFEIFADKLEDIIENIVGQVGEDEPKSMNVS